MKLSNKIEKYDTVYAFIDSQNLNYGTSKDLHNSRGKLLYTGWKLDFKKFRIWLKDKFRVQKAFLFIGYTKENEKLYNILKRYGYILVFKPTVKNSYGKLKGNVDAELVLHSAKIEFTNYNKSVIVSGDGDFACLHEELIRESKLQSIIIPNKFSESSLLKQYYEYKHYLYREREKLERK